MYAVAKCGICGLLLYDDESSNHSCFAQYPTKYMDSKTKIMYPVTSK